MIQTWSVLARLRDKLAAVEGVKTCKVGLEQGIAHEDYPIIRIVPSSLREGSDWTRRRLVVLVYFGAVVDESRDGLEAVYEQLLALEQSIIDAAATPGQGWRCKYLDTITDEDRLEVYKLMAARFEVEG